MNASILIVEDEQILQDVYSLVLRSKGYDVDTANNGKEGLKSLQQKVPAVILLDLFMPVMGGKGFLESINVNDYPDTKIVVYTNLSDRKTEQEMIDLGAHKFVLKSSLSPQELIALVDGLTCAEAN